MSIYYIKKLLIFRIYRFSDQLKIQERCKKKQNNVTSVGDLNGPAKEKLNCYVALTRLERSQMEEEPGEKKQSTNGEQAEQAETAEREASTAQVKVHAMNGSRQEPQKCDKSEEEEEGADKVEDKEGKPDEKDAKEESAEGEEPEVQEDEQQQHKEVEAETAPQVNLEVGEKADQLSTAIIADKPVKAENKTDKEGAATLENVDDKKGDEEEEMEEQQEEEDEVEEEEDDRLSATSSPSALHIHLEEDIKDEAIGIYYLI